MGGGKKKKPPTELEDADWYGLEAPAEVAAKEAAPVSESISVLGQMLPEVAEQFLIGEGTGGGSEARITLRDEYWGGTEVIIRWNSGALSAELVPPNLEMFESLQSHQESLKDRLSRRGLKVIAVSVREPKL